MYQSFREPFHPAHLELPFLYGGGGVTCDILLLMKNTMLEVG